MHHEISFMKCLKARDVECGITRASCLHFKTAASVFVQTVLLTCEYIIQIRAIVADLFSEFSLFVHFKHILGLKIPSFKPQPAPSAVCCSGQIAGRVI